MRKLGLYGRIREDKKRRRREEKKRKRRRNPGLEHLLCLELDISSLEVWNFGLEIVWNSCLEISYVWFLSKLCRKNPIRSVVGWNKMSFMVYFEF